MSDNICSEVHNVFIRYLSRSDDTEGALLGAIEALQRAIRSLHEVIVIYLWYRDPSNEYFRFLARFGKSLPHTSFSWLDTTTTSPDVPPFWTAYFQAYSRILYLRDHYLKGAIQAVAKALTAVANLVPRAQVTLRDAARAAFNQAAGYANALMTTLEVAANWCTEKTGVKVMFSPMAASPGLNS